MLLVLALGFIGYTLSRRLLQESEPYTAAVSGLALALILLLTLVNGFGRFVVISQSIWWAAGILLITGALSLRVSPSPASRLELPRGVWVWLAFCVLFAGFFITVGQNLLPDDDYWIHTPLQGLMGQRTLPPVHPFFSDIAMNGHYGRDLLIVSLAQLSGYKVFATQIGLSTIAMVVASILLFLTLRRHTDSYWASVLGTSFALFGINVGGRAGMVDTYQNNNPIVALYVITILYLLCLLWDTPPDELPVLARRATILGLCLGSLAIVYETHFGLLLLVLVIGTAVRRLMLEKGEDLPVWTALLAVTLAVFMALTQGGPFTKLLEERLLAEGPAQSFSAGEMNQRQLVVITFPKKELFQIQLGHGGYQRVSCVYQAFPFLAGLAPVSDDTPYRPIWSWDVLQIHWLSTWLVPLSLFVCLRRKSWVGLSFLAFGMISFLVPALVHFGPIYEFEYFRWEYAAGFGFATALGLSVGELLGSATKPRLAGFLVALLCFFNLSPFFLIFGPMFHSRWRSYGHNFQMLRPLRSLSWLRLHSHGLNFHEYDLQAALYLRKHARAGARALMNFPTSYPQAIHCESTFVGLSSVGMVGHSLPLNAEGVGTPPYHMAAPARSFWGGFDPVLLAILDVDWLYLRPGPEFDEDTRATLEGLAGVELAASFPPEEPESFLFRVQIPSFVPPPRGEKTLDVEISQQEQSRLLLEPGICSPVELTIDNREGEALPAGTLLECSFAAVDTERERFYARIPKAVPSGQSLKFSFPLVSPHEPGEHVPSFRIERDGALQSVYSSCRTVVVQ